MRPKPRAGARMFCWTNVYAAVAFMVNGFLDSNFGYLHAMPANPSILDHFGPLPRYLLVMEALALFAFTVLYAPFYLGDRFRRDR